LQGYYQQQNVAGVLKAIELLNDAGFSIDHNTILAGLNNVITNTHLKGRWQKLGERPLMICDTGHNIDGMQQLVRQIHDQSFDKLYMVIGMVKDKDITKVLDLLPKEASYYFCQADLPRALDAELLAEQARKAGLTGTVVRDVNEAIRAARSRASESDFIFIGGSTFVVAEIENL
jgi:dihydrofolate synthase/folylpolyglutamate synthase